MQNDNTKKDLSLVEGMHLEIKKAIEKIDSCNNVASKIKDSVKSPCPQPDGEGKAGPHIDGDMLRAYANLIKLNKSIDELLSTLREAKQELFIEEVKCDTK